jgi:hypothetical protein
MRSEAQIALGIEAGSDGRAIGRDPRKMGPDEVRLLGHMPMAPAAAIRGTVSIAAVVRATKCASARPRDALAGPSVSGPTHGAPHSVRPNGHAVGNA